MDNTNTIRRNLIERIYLMNQNQRNENIYHDNILATLAYSNLTRPSSLELSGRDELMQRLNDVSNLIQQSSRQAIFDNMSVRPSSRTISQDPLPSVSLEPAEYVASAVSAESTSVPKPARNAVIEIRGISNPMEIGRDFPSKLHKILSNNGFEEIISWMPHGRSWKVHRPDEFVDKVAPQFFSLGKFDSFTRQANRWGFRRITHGIDRNAYYHEYFLRGLPQMCQKMNRTSKTKKFSIHYNDPNFYSDSISNPPLPQEALHGEFESQSGLQQGLDIAQSIPSNLSLENRNITTQNLRNGESLLPSQYINQLQSRVNHDANPIVPANLSLENRNIATQNLRNEGFLLQSQYFDQLQNHVNHGVNPIVPSFSLPDQYLQNLARIQNSAQPEPGVNVLSSMIINHSRIR